MIKFCKLFIFSLLLSNPLFSQFEISVTVNGLSNQDVYLAFYYGDKNYVVDTAKLDDGGKGIFSGDKKLEEGIYLVVLPSQRYFDLIIDSNTKFSIETDTSSDMRVLVKNLKIENSPVNIQFRDYQNFMFSQTTEAHKHRVMSMDKTISEAKRKKAIAELEKINNEIQKKQNSVRAESPNALLSKIITAFDEPIVPKIGELINGIPVDSTMQYNIYKAGYLKNIDFSDVRILRTPIFHTKLSTFFDKVVIPHPDSIINSIEEVVALIGGNKEFMQYILNYVFTQYSNSKYMGFDAITVHLADRYFLTDYVDWVKDDFKKQLESRVDKMRPNIIGAVAPNLDKAQTTEGTFYPLHSVDSKYTLIVFWEPNCGHCKKEIPILLDIFHKYHHLGFNVYSFYTQRDLNLWKETIAKFEIEPWINVYDPLYLTNFRDNYDIYSTPTMYLLDEKHMIIAKRLTIEFLNQFLEEKLKN